MVTWMQISEIMVYELSQLRKHCAEDTVADLGKKPTSEAELNVHLPLISIP